MTHRSSWCKSSGRRSGHWDQGPDREDRGDDGGDDGGKMSLDPPWRLPAGRRRSCKTEEACWAALPPPHRRAT